MVLPFKYRKRFIDCGLYFKMLPFIQQESTFWSRALNARIDHAALSRFKYAGDYYLWSTFAKECELKIVKAYLGGFKIHKGQLSGDMKAYERELLTITRRPGMIDYALAALDKVIWNAPSSVKKKFNKEGLFVFDHDRQQWT
jgi:hypothetical protein